MSSEPEPELKDLEAIPSAPRAAAHQGRHEAVYLERDVESIMIPAGTPMTIPAGSRVTITQELGGDFTVVTSWGYLARINAEDADALGREVTRPAPQAQGAEEGEFSEAAVWELLRTIYDPEIPVNIVDLGLIYDLKAEPLPGGGHRVEIAMTLTAPGCGMGPVLVSDVQRRAAMAPGVSEVQVNLTFDPPWDRSRLSEEAALALGLF